MNPVLRQDSIKPHDALNSEQAVIHAQAGIQYLQPILLMRIIRARGALLQRLY